MVTRVMCAGCAANAHAVPTWVLPRTVVRLGGASDQVGGFALLLFAREFDRGLFGELEPTFAPRCPGWIGQVRRCPNLRRCTLRRLQGRRRAPPYGAAYIVSMAKARRRNRRRRPARRCPAGSGNRRRDARQSHSAPR
jgi:hypothetical protein